MLTGFGRLKLLARKLYSKSQIKFDLSMSIHIPIFPVSTINNTN